jgi:hypothetical protein
MRIDANLYRLDKVEPSDMGGKIDGSRTASPSFGRRYQFVDPFFTCKDEAKVTARVVDMDTDALGRTGRPVFPIQLAIRPKEME